MQKMRHIDFRRTEEGQFTFGKLSENNYFCLRFIFLECFLLVRYPQIIGSLDLQGRSAEGSGKIIFVGEKSTIWPTSFPSNKQLSCSRFSFGDPAMALNKPKDEDLDVRFHQETVQ